MDTSNASNGVTENVVAMLVGKIVTCNLAYPRKFYNIVQCD